jgi:protein-tyrosine phosphatase
MLKREGLTDVIQVDSAGTSDWHVGAAPDRRTAAAGQSRGYPMAHLRGRQVCAGDFEHFHYILAMDRANLSELKAIKPEHFQGHLGLFMDFAREHRVREVPDPYYGGPDGFDRVLDLVEAGCEGLLAHLRSGR